jgi:hypothetical protein
MRYLLFLFFGFSFLNVAGQNSIFTKFSLDDKRSPGASLFIHFDKNVYTNNESVYFTAYVLKTRATLFENHKILAVSLIRNVDSMIILQHKFEMINGISFGGFDIPDSIQAGDYHFLAYTNQLVNGLPELEFIQPITIKTNIDPSFKASIKLLPPETENESSHSILVSVTNTANQFLSKPLSIQYRYGNSTKTANTDRSGQLLMKLPIEQKLADQNVYIKIKNGKDSSFLSLPLPRQKEYAIVKFYPEGGNSVIGLVNTIGWEVKDQQNRPLAVNAILYKNNQIIDTLTTSNYGMGKFKISFEKNAIYKVKLIHDGILDSLYQLPKAMNDGMVLNIEQAVVQDSLKLQLKSTDPKKIILRIHNFKDIFFSSHFYMNTNEAIITIPLKDVQKGLNTLTITDTLDRPLLERIFFAHYDATDRLFLNTNSENYKTRENVTLKLQPSQIGKEGLVSIAVVQDSRINIKKMNDIESHYYLKNLLDNLPVHVSGLPVKDQLYMEQILLIKGWRRYKLEKFQQSNQVDSIYKIDSLKFTAVVTYGMKSLTKPIGVSLLGDSYVRMTSTTNNGTFDLNIPEFITVPDKRMFLFISNNNKSLYNIQLNDDFIAMNKKVNQLQSSEQAILPSTISNNSVFVIQGNEKSIRLKEVVIKNTQNSDSFITSGKGPPGSNTCGDYVCMYNILNCKNHKNDSNNTQPVEGVVYVGSKMHYHCANYKLKEEKGFILFNGIHSEKEFYENDYKDPLEPAYFSTIYWNYGVVLDPKKETILNFYTSDIIGKFKIIVQGILDKDVLYAEKTFEVTPSIK